MSTPVIRMWRERTRAQPIRCAPSILIENQIRVYDLFRPIPDAVHAPYPLHLVFCFELFRDALGLCHLRNQDIKLPVGLSINLPQVFIQFSSGQEIGICNAPVLLQPAQMPLAPDETLVPFCCYLGATPAEETAKRMVECVNVKYNVRSRCRDHFVLIESVMNARTPKRAKSEPVLPCGRRVRILCFPRVIPSLRVSYYFSIKSRFFY